MKKRGLTSRLREIPVNQSIELDLNKHKRSSVSVIANRLKDEENIILETKKMKNRKLLVKRTS